MLMYFSRQLNYIIRTRKSYAARAPVPRDCKTNIQDKIPGNYPFLAEYGMDWINPLDS